jgi:hypothetical protein
MGQFDNQLKNWSFTTIDAGQLQGFFGLRYPYGFDFYAVANTKFFIFSALSDEYSTANMMQLGAPLMHENTIFYEDEIQFIKESNTTTNKINLDNLRNSSPLYIFEPNIDLTSTSQNVSSVIKWNEFFFNGSSKIEQFCLRENETIIPSQSLYNYSLLYILYKPLEDGTPFQLSFLPYAP